MASRGSVKVSIQGDSRDLERAVTRSDKALDRLNHAGHRAGQALKTGLAVGGLAAAAGVTASARAAIEAEKSQARLEAQLKALGISYKDHAAHIDTVIQKTSQLSGLDDEDLQDSFTNIVRVTGDVNKSLKLTGLAADFARAKHIDVAKAGEIVGKVAGGNTGILSRYGISIDKGATSTEALGKLQEKFKGQAEAYGKTTAGAYDRSKVALENVGEVAGKVMLPVLAKLGNAFADVLVSVQKHWPQIAKVAASVFGPVKTAVNAVRNAITRFVTKNRDDIDSFLKAMRNVGRVVKAVIEDVVIPIFKRMLPGIKAIFEGLVKIIRGAVRVISGVLTLNFGKAWDGVKDIFSGAVKALGGLIRAGTAPVREGVAAVAGAVKKAFGAMVQFLKDRLADVLWVFQKILEGASHLPLIGGKFKKAAEGIKRMRDQLHGAKDDIDNLNRSASNTPGLIGQIASSLNSLDVTPLRTPSGPRGPQNRSASLNPAATPTASAASTGAPATTAPARAGNMMSILNGSIPAPMGTSRSATTTVASAASAGHYNHDQLAQLWIQAGGDPAKADLAAAIALAESRGRPGASNTNTNGSIDRGLWQINSVHGSLSTFDVMANAKAAVKISGNGTNFRPWTVYNTGAYRQFVTGSGGGRRSAGTKRQRRARNKLQRMIDVADAIDQKRFNYEWGGGHNDDFAPSHGTGHGSGPGIGYDCSGAVSHVLHAGDALSSPLTSGGFMKYGSPGPGTVTIYANQGHVWMTIQGRAFGTSSSNPGGGAGWFGGNPTDGYEVRHVPSLGRSMGDRLDPSDDLEKQRHRNQHAARKAFGKYHKGQVKAHGQATAADKASITPTAASHYAQELADLDVYDAGIDGDLDAAVASGDPAAIKAAQDAVIIGIAGRGIVLQKRLKRIRKALKRRDLSTAKRTELTQEMASIIAELKGLGQQAKDVYAPSDTGDGATGEDPNQALIDAINTANELAQQQIDQAKELTAAQKADTDLRARIFGSQTGQILAGIADMVSGQIGGTVGLGIQTPSFAGRGVRY